MVCSKLRLTKDLDRYLMRTMTTITVRDFVNAVTKNPNYLDLDLCVAIGTRKINGGQYDGGVGVQLKRIQSLMLGSGHLIIFADPNPKPEKEEIYLADLNQWPQMVVIGSIPDSFKQ